MSQDISSATLKDLSTGRSGFISMHNLWTPEQKAKAADVLAQIEDNGLEVIRMSFCDPHGLSRSKSITASSFESVMRNGIDCSPGPFIFDTGLDLVFNPFERGGGLNDDEMTGASSFVLVPDPNSFRILPWANKTGWIVGDEYFKSGRPVPFSSRQLLKRMLEEVSARDLQYVVGLEVEWYLTRLVNAKNDLSSVGGFGIPGAAPEVAPINLGYQFQSENLIDEVEGLIREIRSTLLALDIPLRTTEHESGPGQMEFTFDPMPALAAADAMLLFRTATKQLCARAGFHATFMCAPALRGFDASGWHLHQSLFDRSTGENAFVSQGDDEFVSEFATHFAGGLVHHAPATAIFAAPTVNGYKRFSERFSLSPDRATWSADNRGTYLRVLGGPGDPATHFENRLGEPAANPYLYMASQLIAGLDGVDNKIDPGPLQDNPHEESLPRLPASLEQAANALDASELFRRSAGDAFVDFYLGLKRNEWRRYSNNLEENGIREDQNSVSDWEQREYFRNY
ncbi:glutamine synthetase (plasmid) [Rhodococcus qingshengii]|uniref:glutamine synthetase family protein n=1 Tax=Rhodococcus qingshengii TaxID=334542 RepID=UPI0007E530CE|nr:glutamine synthetase family protein [Rhodococcus qingshengii]BCF86681.1 glutamine synthetase [Rhodococcus qingshengii]